MTERIEIVTSDGITLEARWDLAEHARATVVFCHPHPRDGGTMSAPLMVSVTRRLVDLGFSVLRFNFRGTGKSTGSYGYGEAEPIDVAAAIAEARRRDLPLGLTGWSFGAAMALRWHSTQEEPIPYAGIAPPPPLLPDRLASGRKRIILGTRDQVIDRAALQAYAEERAIDLVLTPGDHFFHGRGGKIANLVAEGLSP